MRTAAQSVVRVTLRMPMCGDAGANGDKTAGDNVDEGAGESPGVVTERHLTSAED